MKNPCRDVEYNGKLYTIDMTGNCVTVTEIGLRNGGSGPVDSFIREMTGKEPQIRVEYKTDYETQDKVILAAGWKFSKSTLWRRTWDRLYRNYGGRNSQWGPAIARRVS